MNTPFEEFTHFGLFPKCVTNETFFFAGEELNSSTLGTTKLSVPFWWMMRGFSYSVDWELTGFRGADVPASEGIDFDGTFSLSFPPQQEGSSGSEIWTLQPKQKVCQENNHYRLKPNVVNGKFSPPELYMQMVPFIEKKPDETIYKLHLHSEALYEEYIASSTFKVFVSSGSSSYGDDSTYTDPIIYYNQTLEIPENPYGLEGSFNAVFAWLTQGYEGSISANFYNFNIDWWYPPIPSN